MRNSQKILLILMGLIFSFSLSFVSAGSDVSVFQGQYYIGTAFQTGNYAFVFSIYDASVGGNLIWTDTTTLTTGNWGQWLYEANGVLAACNDSTKNYFLNININGVDQLPRKRLTLYGNYSTYQLLRIYGAFWTNQIVNSTRFTSLSPDKTKISTLEANDNYQFINFFDPTVNSNIYGGANWQIGHKTGSNDLYITDLNSNGGKIFLGDPTTNNSDYSITGTFFTSDIPTGTAPYQTASTTLNANLNADLLDGMHANNFCLSNGTNCINQTANVSGLLKLDQTIPQQITNGPLDILTGYTSILMGADVEAFQRSNNKNKNAIIAVPNYKSSEEDVKLISLSTGSASNIVQIGGGSDVGSVLYNAVTDIKFYTATNSSTTGGTEALHIQPDGKIQMANYSTNGFVKFTGNDGTLSVDTTTYLSNLSQLCLANGTNCLSTTNLTNIALTNQSNNFGANNLTAANFFGNINWSYIQSIPGFALISNIANYVGNWSGDKINYYNKTQVDGLLLTAGNSSFNQTLTDSLYLNKSDQRYNETNLINSLNSTSLSLLNDSLGDGYTYVVNKTGYINMTSFDVRYLAGGQKSFYFTNHTSDVAGMYNTTLSLSNLHDTTTVITGSAADGETTIAEFLSQPEAEYRVASGIRIFSLNAKADSITKIVQLKCYIYVTNATGGNQTLLRTSTTSIPLTLAAAEYVLTAPGNVVVIKSDQRILFKVVSIKESGGPNIGVSLYVEDSTYSRLDVPSPVAVTDISSKLDITDQRYNDTALFNSINSSIFYNKTSNINATGYNLTADYISGKPIMGMLGSGLISSSQGTGTKISDINVTCVGLTCSYNSFEMRLTSGDVSTPAKYCNIPNGTLIVPDNTNAMYYIDSNCAVQQTTYDTWFSSTMTSGGVWDFANILTHSGSAEVIDTISLEERRLMKARQLNYYEWQGKVISGFNFQTNAWSSFNITSGKTVYGMDVVDVNKHTINATDTLELVGHASSNTWQYSDQTGLNVTTCDTGTTLSACTGNNYRRHFIFSVGYDSGNLKSEIHQLFPLQSTSYSTLANCLDTTTNPLIYSLPNEYSGSAVMLYAYCSQRTSTTWNTAALIDLRTIKTGQASGNFDTSSLVPYSGATGSVNLNGYNLTASNLFGSLNWSYIQNAPTITSVLFNSSQFTNVSTTWSINTTWLTNFIEGISKWANYYVKSEVYNKTETYNKTEVDAKIIPINYTNVAMTNASNNFAGTQNFSNITLGGGSYITYNSTGNYLEIGVN